VSSPAARVGDMHTCPMFDGPKPHVGGPILPVGCPIVLIAGRPAARVTDMATCASAPDLITKGSPTVLIGNCGLPAARMGDNTVHGGLIVQGEPTVLIGESATVFGPGPLTPEQAQQLFDIMAAQGDIAFGYPVDGCYARAEIMAGRMQQLGVDPSKAWSFARPGQALSVRTGTQWGTVNWGYHVAPSVPVLGAGGIEQMVIDPSMFRQPVSVADWAGAQGSPGAAGTTDLGQSPVGRGHGYWPGEDPVEGVERSAFDTMAEYLPFDEFKAGCL
jgi:uncharacterized Zn-binding protein involved in type VI secretion